MYFLTLRTLVKILSSFDNISLICLSAHEWRHNSVEGSSILTKFGRLMQNDKPVTKIRPKSKPEIVFQYGGRPLSETGSSFISAVDWYISLKHCMQIDFRLLKQIPLLNLNPEVHFRLYGRHLEKSMSMTS